MDTKDKSDHKLADILYSKYSSPETTEFSELDEDEKLKWIKTAAIVDIIIDKIIKKTAYEVAGRLRKVTINIFVGAFILGVLCGLVIAFIINN